MFRLIAGICALSILLTTGCTRTQGSPKAATQTNATASLVYHTERIPLATGPAVQAGIKTGQFQGDIGNLFYAGPSTVLVDAEKLYLYDLSAGRVLAETEREDFYQSFCQPCGKGFAAIGSGRSTMKGKVVFYNASLKKEGEVTFSQITGSNEVYFPEMFAVSPDGKKIAYYDMNGINLYDVEKKTRKQIFSLENSKIMHIGQLSFTQDSKTLILLSGVENGGGQSIPACGKINIDGTELVNASIPGFTPYEIAGSYDRFALFGEDDRNRTGRALSLDTADGTTRFLPLATKQERVVFGSDGGAYYAASALEDSGCTVRVYETATGKQVGKQFIPHGGNALYVARNPVVRILDKSKTGIVLMGNRQDDLETKVTCFQF